ncbi:MAG: hypothetical protein VX015_14755 [Planctomycetota bacterium]|nr:hypothetical protein [Planctomycetota bacterium]
MSKKNDLIARLIAEVKLRHPVPKSSMEGVNLLEQGAVLVLMRHMTQNQAEQSVKSLKAAYEDWNEIRVAQSQEIAKALRTSSRKKGVALLRARGVVAMALKDYLQDVFQQTHHLDLEELREDEQTAGKAAASLKVLGFPGAAFLMYVAADGQFPVHLPLVRLMDRLDLIGRTTSLKKARAAIEPLIPKGQELAFTLAFHEILERWEDEDEPIYMTVKSLRETPYGKKTAKERETAIARAEAAARREEERIRKEEERERKKLEAEAKKRARELERKRKAEEKKLAEAKAKAAAAEKKKREAARKKEEAAKKKAAEKAAAAKKRADERAAAAKKKAAEKAAAAKKKAAEKAAAAKKKAAERAAAAKKKAAEAAKKGAASKKKPAKKKAPARKASPKKKPATKRSAAKKAATKKSGVKKTSTKKPTAKKKAAAKKAAVKKPATRKQSARKTVAKKKATTKKATTKKAAARKPAARKKVAKKSTRRR